MADENMNHKKLNIIFVLIRGLSFSIFIPIILILIADIIFSPFLHPLLRIIAGVFLVLVGVHLLLFRKRHSEEHFEEMIIGLENARGNDAVLFRNPAPPEVVKHFYSYLGVLLTFIGLLFIFAS